MGGDIELKIMAGSVHGGTEFFTDKAALDFLLALQQRRAIDGDNPTE